MLMKSRTWFCRLLLGAWLLPAAQAQMVRPPAFIGGIAGKAQFQAIQLQRHQARTLRYREALEDLRRNPAAADVPECKPGQDPKQGQCLVRPGAVAVETSPVRRRFAVLVGNNQYAAPIPALDTPIADVAKSAEVLRSRFGHEARIVSDAGKARIIEALNDIAAEARPEDSVLLFCAGHGYLLDDVKTGYCIPVDASVKTAQGWISNKDIAKLPAAIRARQPMLISDSCCSGSLTPGAKVWSTVRTGVSEEYPQQPQYGAVVSAGHAERRGFSFPAAQATASDVAGTDI